MSARACAVCAAAASFLVALEMGIRSISARRGVRTVPSVEGPIRGNLVTRARKGASTILRKVTVWRAGGRGSSVAVMPNANRSEEHTSELQSHLNLVCRLLLEKKKKTA